MTDYEKESLEIQKTILGRLDKIAQDVDALRARAEKRDREQEQGFAAMHELNKNLRPR